MFDACGMAGIKLFNAHWVHEGARLGSAKWGAQCVAAPPEGTWRNAMCGMKRTREARGIRIAVAARNLKQRGVITQERVRGCKHPDAPRNVGQCFAGHGAKHPMKIESRHTCDVGECVQAQVLVGMIVDVHQHALQPRFVAVPAFFCPRSSLLASCSLREL